MILVKPVLALAGSNVVTHASHSFQTHIQTALSNLAAECENIHTTRSQNGWSSNLFWLNIFYLTKYPRSENLSVKTCAHLHHCTPFFLTEVSLDGRGQGIVCQAQAHAAAPVNCKGSALKPAYRSGELGFNRP